VGYSEIMQVLKTLEEAMHYLLDGLKAEVERRARLGYEGGVLGVGVVGHP